MTAPFEVGDRVVCPDPTGRWFVGVVTHIRDPHPPHPRRAKTAADMEPR